MRVRIQRLARFKILLLLWRRALLIQVSFAAQFFQLALALVLGRVFDRFRRRRHRLADFVNQAARTKLFWFALRHIRLTEVTE